MAEAAAARTLVLVGGNEWQPGCEEADRWWASRSRAPVVTVVTTAAQAGSDSAVARSRRYFAQLGIRVEPCLIQTVAAASDPRWLVMLERSAAVYLCGGDPEAAREVLWGSRAGAVIATIFRRGVPVIGSSAGAMVLAGTCLAPAQRLAQLPGLGLVPRAVVVPHWNSAGQSWKRRAAQLAREYEVLAIDELTSLCWDGSGWAVLGPGRARVLTPAGERPVGDGVPSPPIE